jgi:Asp-tRNAAsn/Glu-tRNAGln amidotransferase B subunit (PET112 homolog)
MLSHLEKFLEILQKNALYEIVKTGNNISQIISDLDLGNVSDESELTGIIQEIITSEPQAVEQAKSNPQTINYLVGKVMQKTKGKADPKLTLDLLKKLIE